MVSHIFGIFTPKIGEEFQPNLTVAYFSDGWGKTTNQGTPGGLLWGTEFPGVLGHRVDEITLHFSPTWQAGKSPLFKKWEIHLLGGGFKHFLCSSLFREDSHFDQYFSDGLKPPTSLQLVCFPLSC